MSTQRPRTNIDVRECVKKIGGIKEDEVFVFQIPVATEDLTENYILSAKRAIEGSMPNGKQAIIIGNDVDIYAVSGEEALTLKLKGIGH